MKRLLSLIFTGLSLGVQAQVLKGLKADPVSAATKPADSGMSLMPLVQMTVALLIVFALIKWLLPKVVAKMQTKGGAGSGGIQIEESAPIGSSTLYLVKVRGQEVLLTADSSGLRLLCELRPAGPEPKEAPAFFEKLDEAIEETPAAFRPEPRVAKAAVMRVDDLDSAMARLERLAS